jgi:hypothetical protein
MKTPIFLLLTIMMCLSCTKEPIESTETGNVTVTLNYVFPSRSGDITTKGESPYLGFYNKYISGKVLTPRTYYLVFESIGVTPNFAQAMGGKWGSKIFIPLPTGKYSVTGQSVPLKYNVCGDTCYLIFHDTINITQSSTDITLKAYYNCSLILLDTTDVKSTELFTNDVLPADAIKPTMLKTADFYHIFYADGPANGNGCNKVNLNLKITSRQILTTQDEYFPFTIYVRNKSLTMYLYLYKWDAGKYYYFEETANGYDLAPMTNGK